MSILWFPFFLAVAMSALFVAPLANPAPRDMRIGVVGASSVIAEVQGQFDAVHRGGFVVTAVAAAAAAEQVRQGAVAAAILAGDHPRVLVASSTGATRVEYLRGVLPTVVSAPVDDIAPSAAGDATGTGVFFYALPIGIVSMVSAIVLLQLGAWSYRRKLLAITVIAAFTAAVTWVIALWQHVVTLTGPSALLMLGTFVFVQAVAWTLTGAAEFLRQFLVPFALTFVLVLGVPTAGAPVLPDMLPRLLGALHQVMPLGQFIELVRALAYGAGSPLHPAIVLGTWFVIGAALIMLADRHRTRQHEQPRSASASTLATHQLRGTVTSLSGGAVSGAVVRVFTAEGGEMLSTMTSLTGEYELGGIGGGTHHVLVTADHAQPEVITVVVPNGVDRRHDFALQMWNDPAANLTADAAGERGLMSNDRS